MLSLIAACGREPPALEPRGRIELGPAERFGRPTPEGLAVLPGEVLALAVRHDGRGALRFVRLVDLGEARPEVALENNEPVSLVATRDGRYLALGFYVAAPGSLRAVGQPEVELVSLEPRGVVPAAFSPDGQLLAAEGPQGVHLFRVPSGEPLGTLAGTRPRFSPDGKLLAVLLANDAVALHRADDRTRVRTLRAPRDDEGVELAFSPDGRHLATYSFWRQLRIFEVETGGLLHDGDVGGSNDYGPGDLAFTADGKTLLVTGPKNAVTAVDVPSGKRLGVVIEDGESGGVPPFGAPTRRFAGISLLAVEGRHLFTGRREVVDVFALR